MASPAIASAIDEPFSRRRRNRRSSVSDWRRASRAEIEAWITASRAVRVAVFFGAMAQNHCPAESGLTSKGEVSGWVLAGWQRNMPRWQFGVTPNLGGVPPRQGEARSEAP